MYVFTRHLKARGHAKFNINFPWFGIQMNFKGPHNFMVTALCHYDMAKTLYDKKVAPRQPMCCGFICTLFDVGYT